MTVVGSGGSWTSEPTADGFFSFEVPLGTYELKVRAPARYVAEETDTIEIRDPHRCIRTSVQLRWTGIARGRLLDADGRPVAHCDVVIITRRFAQRRDYRWEQRQSTDADGEFVHKYLGPGEYILGIHIESDARGKGYPAFYLPGVAELQAARVVEITLGSEIDTDDFRLPVRVDKVPVEGSVLMPDGTSAPDARVSLYGEEQSFEAIDAAVVADANGRFRISGLRGRRYTVSAYLQDNDVHLSGSIEVRAGDIAPVVIRLTP